MNDKLGYSDSIGFGNLTTLKEISTTDNTNNKKSKQRKTRVIRISEDLYLHFIDFSKRYYNVESYNTILENLLKDFEYHNKDKTWRDIDR